MTASFSYIVQPEVWITESSDVIERSITPLHLTRVDGYTEGSAFVIVSVPSIWTEVGLEIGKWQILEGIDFFALKCSR